MLNEWANGSISGHERFLVGGLVILGFSKHPKYTNKIHKYSIFNILSTLSIPISYFSLYRISVTNVLHKRTRVVTDGEYWKLLETEQKVSWI